MVKRTTQKTANVTITANDCGSCCQPKRPGSDCGFLYGLGFIGAAVYYVQTATGFWMGVLGILKALVWPAMLVYKLLAL